jgi:hypothetical protein
MLGCQIAQGFYFSQPLQAAEFDDLLTRHFVPVPCALGAGEPAGQPSAAAVSRAR